MTARQLDRYAYLRSRGYSALIAYRAACGMIGALAAREGRL